MQRPRNARPAEPRRRPCGSPRRAMLRARPRARRPEPRRGARASGAILRGPGGGLSRNTARAEHQLNPIPLGSQPVSYSAIRSGSVRLLRPPHPLRVTLWRQPSEGAPSPLGWRHPSYILTGYIFRVVVVVVVVDRRELSSPTESLAYGPRPGEENPQGQGPIPPPEIPNRAQRPSGSFDLLPSRLLHPRNSLFLKEKPLRQLQPLAEPTSAS